MFVDILGRFERALVEQHVCYPPENHGPLDAQNALQNNGVHPPMKSYYECPECGKFWEPLMISTDRQPLQLVGDDANATPRRQSSAA
jgi:hypothetical protein